jgi:hypothetical protein
MNTILFISACVILGLVVLAKIPGLEHTVRPLIDLVFTAIKAILENLVSWLIWLFKVLWEAHLDLLKNLVLPAEAIDPSLAVKRDPVQLERD